jgi:hypothetical protein
MRLFPELVGSDPLLGASEGSNQHASPALSSVDHPARPKVKGSKLGMQDPHPSVSEKWSRIGLQYLFKATS